MNFGISKEDLKLLKSVFSEFAGINQAIIFGSRAMDNYKKGSDIDIAIKGEIDSEVLAKINYRLNEELPLPYFFDVVNYNKIKNKKLVEHIDKYGIIFFTGENS